MTSIHALELIDSLTPAIRPIFQYLPAHERKVFAFLCSEFETATAKEIAVACRMTSSQVSAFLSRLVSRNLVRVHESGKSQAGNPPKMYRVAVPLVAIWYRIRRHGTFWYPLTDADFETLKSCQWTEHQFQAVALADACVMRDDYIPFGPTKHELMEEL